jgi:hypothetical protein
MDVFGPPGAKKKAVGGWYPPTALNPYVGSRGQQADLPKKEKEAEEIKVCPADPVQHGILHTVYASLLEAERGFVKKKMSIVAAGSPICYIEKHQAPGPAPNAY